MKWIDERLQKLACEKFSPTLKITWTSGGDSMADFFWLKDKGTQGSDPARRVGQTPYTGGIFAFYKLSKFISFSNLARKIPEYFDAV